MSTPTLTDLATKAIDDLSVAEINELDFSRVVALTNEPNMCSGGGATVRRVLQLAGPLRGRPVLEVGSNTGFTSIEMASWLDSPVTGLDVNPVSNAFAEAKAKAAGIDNVNFVLGDGQGMPFEDDSFDLVFASNVTSFMTDHRRACDEYYRVLSPRGVLAAVPIYYRSTPPESLRKAVEAAIGVPLPITSEQYWIDIFSREGVSLIEAEPYEYVRQTPERINAYVETVMDQSHLARQSAEKVAALRSRLAHFYDIFDENLSYAGYSILLFRSGHPNPEPILHTTRRVHENRA
ncbi:methyltransferase domain-containing protein [Streptomyces sp. SL13]|uniref:Methyltransferase domain-containing protein n=1 Tax=Streptantibioticus silvisoli TaxID=2705255 RepID=A0AA90H451_9ACTN|nr:class I SAM-dependent methyltransferase [Streptantibioticus silvisoli]MDI5961131.1 methyltransferase domain-containing protein [Streptantibioticus silvisoli]MDI5970936.1 methyltransferase domain-containing protein [Streptantibioticus silvisoli]